MVCHCVLGGAEKNRRIETGFRVHVPTSCVSASFVNYELFGTIDMFVHDRR